ncbi:MAG: glycosyltransferase N-terminal domain-containing protein [Bacteroidota bacterium]|nr:glycosyltransferase N-terminal domain-containing protein [Bacteroidota bacterium]
MIWKIFYNVFVVPIMWVGFHLYSFINQKARRAFKSRKNLFKHLQTEIARLKPNAQRVWFHSSSMGEFEQAKPIIAELKKKHPKIQIIVSFFSPSGYEHSQSYKLADVITYIPFDSVANAKKFIDIVQPSAVVFVRYDLWPNHLWALKEKRIPVFIASATLQIKFYRKVPILKQFIRSLYNSIDYILTVSEHDKDVFTSFNLTKPVMGVIGDTRYDQVWKRSAESKKHQLLDEKIYKSKNVIVIGSSWKEDEERLLPALLKVQESFPNLLVVWVQHEPMEENLEYLEKELNGNMLNIRFSHLHQYQNEKVIVVDSVGILMVLYQYAHIAYVGGSFGNGVHNVLEPASYGIPIMFGPRHMNSQEALMLIKKNAAFVGNDSEELYWQFHLLLNNDERRKQCGSRALDLVKASIGATERFLSYIEKVL